MEEQEQHTDRFLRTEKIENVKKKSKLSHRYADKYGISV